MPEFTSIFVFGDSLSDTGNLSSYLYQATGGQFWYPFSPPFPDLRPTDTYYYKSPYYNGAPLGVPPQVRATNGLNWSDYFSNTLGLPISNFAYTGATSGSYNILQKDFAPVLSLVPPQFNKLPGLSSEIDNFTSSLGSGKADPKGLYTIWIGANDIIDLAAPLDSPPPSNLVATLPSIAGLVKNAVTNIETDVAILAKKGARTFLIPNLPDLGKTPLYNGNKNSAFISTVYSLAFDIELAVDLPKLERSHKIDIVEPDVYSLFYEVLNHPQEFGFKNVTDPLIVQNPNDPLVNPAQFLFYDSQHPTTQAHKYLADFFQDSLFKAGYLSQGSPDVLPQVKGSLLDKEISLIETLVQGIPDLKPSNLIKDLFALIPDAIAATPLFSGQNPLEHLQGGKA